MATEKNETKEKHLRVRSASDVHAVAGAIANELYEEKEVRLRSIGAGALNQAVKAVVLARSFVATRGWDIKLQPAMETVIFDDPGGPQERSAIVLKVIVEK